jgi:transposase
LDFSEWTQVLKIKPHLTDVELKVIMNNVKSIYDFKDWQIIYSVQANPGKKAADIATILSVKPENIYKKVQKYNKHGAAWKTAINRGGRREERCLMSLEKEKEFLKGIEEDAINGHIITYKQVKLKLEKQIEVTVSDDYIWDLFKRHKWTKKVPRQSHPKADKAAQEEYKKNSRRIWSPNH